MPNQVIVKIHRLAVAVEKYDIIVFTNINGNVLSDQFMEDTDDNNTDEIEIMMIDDQQPSEM